MRPMSEFDPSQRCWVHEQLKEIIFAWRSERADAYRRNAIHGGSVEVCMHGSDQHAGGRRHGDVYALGRADRRWTEDERAQKEAALRRLVPDFDERGGSVRIGAAPGASRQRGRWLRIRFQAPLRRDERCEMIFWLEKEDRHIG
jgi:hypothetical protein